MQVIIFADLIESKVYYCFNLISEKTYLSTSDYLLGLLIN